MSAISFNGAFVSVSPWLHENNNLENTNKTENYI